MTIEQPVFSDGFEAFIMEICDNATDDDGDSFVDCRDFDCLGDTSCPG